MTLVNTRLVPLFKGYLLVIVSQGMLGCSIPCHAKVRSCFDTLIVPLIQADRANALVSLPLEIISIVVSIRVDKIYDRKVVWDHGFTDKDSEPYQTLAYEANRAVGRFHFQSHFSFKNLGIKPSVSLTRSSLPCR